MKFFHKKSKAIKRWHSRAMLIDIRKTKVTIVHRGDLDIFDLESVEHPQSELT